MKDRIATFTLAVGALGLFYVFFFPKPASEAQEPTLPLCTDAGPGGYLAVWRWLTGQHIAIAALHEPYTRLASLTASVPSGNLLLTTLPHRVPARRAELDELDSWLAKGNTLVVMAALDDTPRWAIAADASFLRTLRRMSGLDFEAEPDRPAAAAASASERKESRTARALIAVQRLLEPQQISIDPRGSHPLFAGIRSVGAVSEFPASRWHASPIDARTVLEIGERSLPGAAATPAVWLERHGKGQVLVFSVATPFSNAVLAEKDNARLLSNIIAWAREPGGIVIVDDDHQGAVSYYDAKAFFRDPRLHWTLVWILILWLLFVLGWQRMRPSGDRWNRGDITDFLGVTGGFFASSLTSAAAGTRLFQNFFNALRRDLALAEDGQPLWERLAADARVPGSRLGELKGLYERTRAGKSVDLIRLHNLLTSLKSNLE